MVNLLAHGGIGGWLPLELTPIHPILVNFTAALIPTSLAAELLGRWLRKPSLTETGWWTLLLAAIVTPLTAATGLYWKQSMEMPGEAQRMAIHQWLGISLAVLFIGLAVWRGLLFRRKRATGIGYLAALVLLVCLLTLQGHLGGTMSFGGESSDEPATFQSTPMPHMTMTPQKSAETEPATTAVSPTNPQGWSDSIHVEGHSP